MHSRKDGKDGICALVINNSLTEATTVALPKDADVYALAGEGGSMRATVMTLNGSPLVLGDDWALPELNPVSAGAGEYSVAPGSCVFFVL